MSSMFKKRGGLAFKPKIPSARSKTVATAAPSAPTPTGADKQLHLESAPVDSSPSSTSVPHPANAVLSAPSRKSPKPASRNIAESAAGSTDKPSASSHPVRPETRSSARRKAQVADEHHPESTASATHAAAAPHKSQASGVAVTAPSSRTTKVAAANIANENLIQTRSRRASLSRTTPITASGDHDRPQSGPPSSKAKPSTVTADASKGAESERQAPAKPLQRPSSDQTGSSRPKKRQRRAPRSDPDAVLPSTRSRDGPYPPWSGHGAETDTRNRKARSLTPEDAENQTVDLQQLRMADLTKDLRIGKKFSRHDELRDRERQARLKAKLIKDEEQQEGHSGRLAASSPNRQGRTGSNTPTDSPAPAVTSGPQFRIVDGQIVVDQSSLVMDRHARAAAAQAGEDMETIEENDFTRLITSNSFMNSSKLKGPNIWSDAETELFYRGLRMFGTEFEMISKMFPGKQRRHIKLKFNREERHNPERIDAALIGVKTIKMDIDEYQAFTGTAYESVETIEEEQRKRHQGFEEERKRIALEQEEIMRKKREELFADDADQDGPGDMKKKKSSRKKGLGLGLA